MRKVATVILPGLGVVALGAVVWTSQVTAQSSMSSNTSSFGASVAASQASPQLNAGSDLAGNVGVARQSMAIQVPIGIATARESHALGATVSKPDPTGGTTTITAGYSANMSTTLAPAGVSATGGAPQGDTSQVPTGLRLSATGNAAASAIGGATPGGRALGQ